MPGYESASIRLGWNGLSWGWREFERGQLISHRPNCRLRESWLPVTPLAQLRRSACNMARKWLDNGQ